MTQDWRWLCAFALALAGCRGTAEEPAKKGQPRRDVASATVAAPPPSVRETPIPPRTSSGTPLDSRAEFSRAFTQFSEPGGKFWGENLVSNEESYLAVAHELPSRKGGVYVGVGPEQNFSYIALSRPELSFIVDIRRENALIHLLYKAIFEASRDRVEFLCALLTRSCPPASKPGVRASIERLLAYVAKAPPDADGFDARHGALVAPLRERSELQLGKRDFYVIRRLHRKFMQRGLEARFKGRQRDGVRYPTLSELLLSKSPDGSAGSFLSTEALYSTVRALQQQDRIAFVIGDFGKAGALQRLAGSLRERGLVLRTFYVSNVEEYLTAEDVWAAWLDNLRAFPSDADTLLLRSYFSSTRPHPLQLPGQRTTSFSTRLGPWLACEERTPSADYFQAVLRPECNSGS